MAIFNSYVSHYQRVPPLIRPQYGLPRAHAGRLGGGSHLPPVEACEVRGYREGHQGRDPWGGGDRGGIGDVSDQLTYTLYIYIYIL